MTRPRVPTPSRIMKPLRLLALVLVLGGLVSLAACSKSNKDGARTADRYGKHILFDTRYDQVDLARAKSNAADVLTRLGDKDNICLIGLWAYNPPQILNAVKDVKKEG